MEELAWLEARRKEKEEDARRRRRLSQDDPTPTEALLLTSPDSARIASSIARRTSILPVRVMVRGVPSICLVSKL